MRVAMIGTGYVGLVSGACFSEFGHHVTCIDKEVAKIEGLRRGRIPIYEPDLDRLVTKNVEAGRLDFQSVAGDAIAAADAVFIAVGTPSRRGDGHADLTYVFEAAREIAGALDGYTAVITKSTVPIGTGRKVAEIIRKAAPQAEFDTVSNPEFLREGSAIGDFMRPDRVVIGAESERVKAVMRELYRPLYLIDTPMVYTDLETAELIKYAGNAFLATKITFINEIADLCEKVGADVQDVARGIGLDGRIGRKFLHAGPGYGGSCFPKDTVALIQSARDAAAPLRIVETVAAINSERKKTMASRIEAACGGSMRGKTVAVLGLAYKPNTDDMREAPSLDIVPGLLKRGAKVRGFDPAASGQARQMLPGIELCADAYATMQDADVLVIVTEWNEFRALDLGRVKELMRRPVVVDLRNIYRPADMAAAGFDYHSIGRPRRAER
jgi:UDPglucose 6-dehydrogenase